MYKNLLSLSKDPSRSLPPINQKWTTTILLKSPSGYSLYNPLPLPSFPPLTWGNTIYSFRISTTHRMQSPCFMNSNALLMPPSACRCVMNSSTFSFPAM